MLSSYSMERSAIAKLVLEATGKATAMAVMKGGIKQSIRNYIASLVFGLAPVTRMMANLLSEVAVAYSESVERAIRACARRPRTRQARPNPRG
jgi:hypothetical protein